MDTTLDKAIDGFKLSNEASGLADKTISWYDSNLKLFQKWLHNHLNNGEVKLEEISDIDLKRYLSELRNKDSCFEEHPFRPEENHSLSPRTIRGYYASLSAFFNWAVREDFLFTSPLENIPKPKTPKYLPDPFSKDDIQALLEASDELPESTSHRAKAMVLFLLDSGVRLSEMVNLKHPDVDLKTGRAKIVGKGAKERFVYFGRKTKKALWRYISLTRPEPMPTVINLFLSVDGRAMKNRRIGHILSNLGNKAEIEDVHAHRFRRTAAVQFVRNGGSIFALQKLLGHESLEMVRRYVELASKDVENAHRTASPVDRWNL
jgi:site-specific recombinase XerD